MKDRKKKLPIGIEDFEELQMDDFYYVDKTNFIRDLLTHWAKVNLFTRPRRFGKSLTLSMLKYFFSPGGNKEIFYKLQISKETELCQKYMGKYPVIWISMKDINAATYEKAFDMAVRVIRAEVRRFQYLLESRSLTSFDKEAFTELLKGNLSETALCSSLKVLSELLEKHYGSKIILLIDEYDVPLEKAFARGYYEQMVLLIRNMLEHALKTNDSLKFSVLTGCMRISKESIFTGLNNLKVLSVTDVQYDEFFGFTDREVRQMLEYYHMLDHYEEAKDWYDGYQFGKEQIYCPWDVLNYCDALQADPETHPKNYWTNTSSNEAVKRFIQKSDKASAKREIEKLIAGEVITKEIHQELTYQDMYASAENLWSVLLTTGYLTLRGRPEGDICHLVIPNLEIRKIYTTQIMEYFRERLPENGEALKEFCEALRNGDPKRVEEQLSAYLKRTISIRDTFVKKKMKENFYHGILLGILGYQDTLSVSSNKESGDGYSDILIETEDGETGIVIELKYAQDGKLNEACQGAFEQIASRRYEEELLEEGVGHILKYGIAFYKKRCMVMLDDN